MSNPLVEHILREGARAAYLGEQEPVEMIPVDRRCNGCGVERDRCDETECHQLWIGRQTDEHDGS